MPYGDLLEAGQLDQALAALQGELRQSPGDVDRWVHLFALQCVMGRFEKALGGLQKAASLDEGWVGPAQENRLLISCELARREVFAGKRRPLILGEPPAWVALYVEALALEAQGRTQEAGELRARAWGDAPVLAAKVNGQPCESLVDADERIGPILEAYLDGRYYWIPFGQIQRLESEPAKVLIELVWLPSTLKLATGAEVKAYLPVRYPGSEEAADAGLRLARRTEWRRVPGGGYAGVGQRMFEHSQGDVPLLECRLIEFSPPAQADSASSTAGV